MAGNGKNCAPDAETKVLVVQANIGNLAKERAEKGRAFRTGVRGYDERRGKKARPLSGPGFSWSDVRSASDARSFSYGVGNVKSTSVRFARILPPITTMWLAVALSSWQ